MHRCVRKHQNVRIINPPVPHFPYVGIRDPPVPNNVIGKKTSVIIREPSVRGWTCNRQEPSNPAFLSYFQIKEPSNPALLSYFQIKELSNPAFLSYFQIREPSILFCSSVSNSNSESENPRFWLFYGIPVMSPRNLLGCVTLH
jgi:hypothetical protein